jgi:hypothetical protein
LGYDRTPKRGQFRRPNAPESTFSKHVARLMSPNCWNTKPTCRRTSRRSLFDASLTRIPITSTEPDVGLCSPFTCRSSVDFPEPDKPMRQSNCPRGISRLTWSNARVPFGNLFEMSLNRTIGSACWLNRLSDMFKCLVDSAYLHFDDLVASQT